MRLVFLHGRQLVDFETSHRIVVVLAIAAGHQPLNGICRPVFAPFGRRRTRHVDHAEHAPGMRVYFAAGRMNS
jgi:hypothetical protein